MGILFVFAMETYGCYGLEVVSDDNVEPTSDDASVYASLCRYWERCRPDRLDFFPGANVQGCTAYYNCFYSQPVHDATFKEADVCRGHIESSVCDDTLSAVAIKPAATAYTLVEAAMGAVGSDGVALEDVPGCSLNNWDLDTEQEPSFLPGDPCFVDLSSCSGDLYCRASSPYQIVGESFCGVCEAPRAVGESCDETILCESNAGCDGETCQARPTLGDLCEDDSDCIEGSCLAGICATVGSIGDLCDSGNDCETEVCGKDGLCSEYMTSDLGEPCEQTETSMPSYCDPDRALICIDQTCEPLSDVNDPCRTSYDCRLGLICHTGQCMEAVCNATLGDFCDNRLYFCETGYFCDSVTEICHSPMQEGEPCGVLERCASGLLCRQSGENNAYSCTQLEPKADGAACTYSYDCQSGYCAREDLECQIYSPWLTSCDKPPCDDCGVCTQAPTVSSCDSL